MLQSELRKRDLLPMPDLQVFWSDTTSSAAIMLRASQ